MYFKYALEEKGEVITDGKQILARLQVKTEKLIKYKHHVEFFSGIQYDLKSDGLWSAKNFQIFNERDELVGSIKPKDNPKKVWLEMLDRSVLKNKYSFEVQSGKWKKNLVIRNESGTVIAQFMGYCSKTDDLCRFIRKISDGSFVVSTAFDHGRFFKRDLKQMISFG